MQPDALRAAGDDRHAAVQSSHRCSLLDGISERHREFMVHRTSGRTAHDRHDLLDRLTIRQLVEDWAVLRDARQWERFRTVWHDDGRMMATWFQGSRDEFIKVSEEGYARGVRILHFLGGSTVESRATAPSRRPR